MPSRQMLRSLMQLLAQATDGGLRLTMTTTAGLVIVGGGLAALAPLALKHLVDAAAEGVALGRVSLASIMVPGVIYVAVLCAGRLIGDVRPVLVNEVEQRLMEALRRRFVEHALRLPLARLLRQRSGELQHSLDLGGAGAQLVVTHLIATCAPVVVELGVMAVVLAQMRQPDLILLFGCTAVGYLAVFGWGAVRTTRQVGAITDASIAVHGQLADSLANVETLRCFGGEGAAEEAVARESSRLVGAWRDYHRLSAVTAILATSVFAISLTACLSVAADQVVRGSLSVGGLMLSCVYLLQMMRPLEIVGSAAKDLARALGYVEPLLNVLSEPAEPQRRVQRMSATKAPDSPPTIRFEGLTFGYNAQHPVILDLNLEIPAGTTTAIVGPSGSGKSSLIRLMLRLYTPQSGRILLNDRPIDSLDVADLRSRIALVPQDTALLHAPIGTNIALGRPDAGHADIALAAAAAQFDRVVDSLPSGYQTLVGERGLKLSGGERQRLAIARALLRQPAILLLDEPTSLLDSRIEAETLQAIKRVAAGSTTLIIAHRLSTVMDADDIVVLDRGRIRERGTHQDLLARDGLYAQLWKRQFNGEVPRSAEQPPTA